MTKFEKVSFLIGRETSILILNESKRYWILAAGQTLTAANCLKAVEVPDNYDQHYLNLLLEKTPEEIDQNAIILENIDNAESILYASRKEPSQWFDIDIWQNDRSVRWQRLCDSIGITDEVTSNFFNQPMSVHSLDSDQTRELWLHYMGL